MFQIVASTSSSTYPIGVVSSQEKAEAAIEKLVENYGYRLTNGKRYVYFSVALGDIFLMTEAQYDGRNQGTGNKGLLLIVPVMSLETDTYIKDLSREVAWAKESEHNRRY